MFWPRRFYCNKVLSNLWMCKKMWKRKNVLTERTEGKILIWDTVNKEKLPKFTNTNKTISVKENGATLQIGEEIKLMNEFLVVWRSWPTKNLQIFGCSLINIHTRWICVIFICYWQTANRIPIRFHRHQRGTRNKWQKGTNYRSHGHCKQNRYKSCINWKLCSLYIQIFPKNQLTHKNLSK